MSISQARPFRKSIPDRLHTFDANRLIGAFIYGILFWEGLVHYFYFLLVYSIEKFSDLHRVNDKFCKLLFTLDLMSGKLRKNHFKQALKHFILHFNSLFSYMPLRTTKEACLIYRVKTLSPDGLNRKAKR